MTGEDRPRLSPADEAIADEHGYADRWEWTRQTILGGRDASVEAPSTIPDAQRVEDLGAKTPPLPPVRNLAAELVNRGDGWHVSPELVPEQANSSNDDTQRRARAALLAALDRPLAEENEAEWGSQLREAWTEFAEQVGDAEGAAALRERRVVQMLRDRGLWGEEQLPGEDGR